MEQRRIKSYAGGPLMAVDALGRPTPSSADGLALPRANRMVGLFYFLWLGEHGRHKPYDISKLVAEDPEIGCKPNSKKWGGVGVYHHWGEPFYGYYYSDDEWVVRHHMKLIMQADIDFLFFDTTNAVIYEKNAKLVMRVLQEYHDEGWKIPRVMFYTNTHSGDTVERLYEAIYRPNYCRDTWFCMNGRPIIIADPKDCSQRARDFFCIKLSQWPNEPDKRGGWPWMDFTRPQRVFENLQGEREVINVSVAQHPQLRFGDSVLYGETGNCGRAFHHGRNDPNPDAYLYGGNFAEQFDRALEIDPPIVLVTGWNEWIAGYWNGTPERPVMFVDCANYEYSRDIEMMRGGYFDNYFMQLVSYVRRYKGAPEAPSYPARGAEDHDIGAVYECFEDGDFARCAEGQGGVIYENRSQRNVALRIEVTHDCEWLTFDVTTKQAVTPYDGVGSWMKVYLNTDGGRGYRFVLNELPSEDGTAAVARILGEDDALQGQILVDVRARYEVCGSRFRVSVRLDDIGLSRDDFTVWFKVADSTEPYAAIEDFYDKGAVAPLGRLNFVYHGRS